MTPDGPGNITNVDLLREQSVVRLDDAPEAPKRYRNCELNVLRNGKGSREGIVIPRERPERYRAPEEEIDEPALSEEARAFFDTDAGDAGEEKRRSRRGGRGRRRGEKPDAPQEQAAKPEKADKPPKSDKPRGERRRGEKPAGAPKAEKPKADKPKTEKPKTDNQPKQEGAEGDKPRRHHHRGGRNHRHGGGGEGGAPKAEA